MPRDSSLLNLGGICQQCWPARCAVRGRDLKPVAPAASDMYRRDMREPENLPHRFEEGMRPGTRRATIEVAGYFVERNCAEHGGEPVLLRQPLEASSKAVFRTEGQMVDSRAFHGYDVRAMAYAQGMPVSRSCFKLAPGAPLPDLVDVPCP